MDFTCEGNAHVPALGKISITAQLFADDLCIGSCTVNGLQKVKGKAIKYCND
jgi:hypothetical protein